MPVPVPGGALLETVKIHVRTHITWIHYASCIPICFLESQPLLVRQHDCITVSDRILPNGVAAVECVGHFVDEATATGPSTADGRG